MLTLCPIGNIKISRLLWCSEVLHKFCLGGLAMRLMQKDVDAYVELLCKRKTQVKSKEEMLSILKGQFSKGQAERIWKRYLFVFKKKI